MAKGRVLMVEEGSVTVANKELRAGGIGIAAAGHGNDAVLVRMVVQFGLDGIARTAGAPGAFLAGVFGQGIAALDHKTLDDAVKAGAVVKALARKFLEIVHGVGR